MELSTGCGGRRPYIVELPRELYALLPPRRGLALVRHVAQQRLHHCLQAAAINGHLTQAIYFETSRQLRLVCCLTRPPACLPLLQVAKCNGT